MEKKLITPEFAKQLLANNTDNRNVSKAAVELYASDMQKGNWVFNGDTIRVDETGNLLDGQHRLHACVKANKPFEAIYIDNLPRSTFKTIDSGKIRSKADVFNVAGYSYSCQLPPVVNAIMAYRMSKKVVTGGGLRSKRFSNTELLEFASNDPYIEDCVRLTGSKFPKLNSIMGNTTVAFCYYMFSKIDKEKADNLFSSMNSGAGLEEKSSILYIREKFIEAKERRINMRPSEKSCIMFKLWNRVQSGDTSRMRFVADDYFPNLKG